MTYSIRSARMASLWLALSLTSGCIIPKTVGNGPDDGDDGGSADSETAEPTEGASGTGEVPATEGSGSDGEPTSGTGEAPPIECFGLPDEPTCLDAGCSFFETVTGVSDTCECTPGVPACLLFLDGIGGSAAPNYFWHEDTLTVAMFSTDWLELPGGWRRCSDAGAPPACDCYEPFMEPMCP